MTNNYFLNIYMKKERKEDISFNHVIKIYAGRNKKLFSILSVMNRIFFF